MQQPDIRDLLRRVQQGDAEAAKLCVQHFEPQIRRAARVHLRDPRLRAVADSVDISQSVFGTFFAKYADSDIMNEPPTRILALLIQITKNRVIDLARKHKTGRAAQLDPGRICVQLGSLDTSIDEAGPSTIVASEDLIEFLEDKFTQVELDLLHRRNRGQTWIEIAAELGKSADSLRKQLRRALDRVKAEVDPDLVY